MTGQPSLISVQTLQLITSPQTRQAAEGRGQGCVAVEAPLGLFQVLVYLQGTHTLAEIQLPLDCTELCKACLPLHTLWTSTGLWWSVLQKRLHSSCPHVGGHLLLEVCLGDELAEGHTLGELTAEVI